MFTLSQACGVLTTDCLENCHVMRALVPSQQDCALSWPKDLSMRLSPVPLHAGLIIAEPSIVRTCENYCTSL
jgi:hypothetical protein